jgi:hypothetical protein
MSCPGDSHTYVWCRNSISTEEKVPPGWRMLQYESGDLHIQGTAGVVHMIHGAYAGCDAMLVFHHHHVTN